MCPPPTATVSAPCSPRSPATAARPPSAPDAPTHKGGLRDQRDAAEGLQPRAAALPHRPTSPDGALATSPPGPISPWPTSTTAPSKPTPHRRLSGTDHVSGSGGLNAAFLDQIFTAAGADRYI